MARRKKQRKKDDGLRDELRGHLPGVHWQSIEMWLLASGVPDANGCYRGAEFWVECKATAHWVVGLEPAQVGWITRRCRAGGRVFVAVRRRHPPRRRAPATDQLWLLAGAFARDIKRNGLRGLPPGAVLGTWDGGPARWDWAAVLGLLAGR